MKITGWLDWPFVAPHTPLKLDGQIIGEVTDCEPAGPGVNVTFRLFPPAPPELDPDAEGEAYSIAYSPWGEVVE